MSIEKFLEDLSAAIYSGIPLDGKPSWQSLNSFAPEQANEYRLQAKCALEYLKLNGFVKIIGNEIYEVDER